MEIFKTLSYNDFPDTFDQSTVTPVLTINYLTMTFASTNS